MYKLFRWKRYNNNNSNNDKDSLLPDQGRLRIMLLMKNLWSELGRRNQ